MPFGPVYLKEPRFLDFFFRRLKATPDDDAYGSLAMRQRWPYVSLCGRERNFVRAARTAIVYQDLLDNELCYAGTLRVPFRPETLSVVHGELLHGENLVATQLASDLLLKNFDDASSCFTWEGKSHLVPIHD